MDKIIIALNGLIGCGKDTVADILVNRHDFVRFSYAESLKDAVAAVFGWDRRMLEGTTPDSRQWRERVDTWWAQRLEIPHLTPRWILQYWGTDVLRGHFHDAIWVASTERRVLDTNRHVVISDLRFPNEATSIRNLGGTIVRINRGATPDWWECAKHAPQLMREKWPTVHSSEYSLANTAPDYILDNSGSRDALVQNVAELIKALEK